MTATSPEPNPQPDTTPPPADPPAYTPPATQADLDRIISDRLARERAKYADYADLKKLAAEAQKAREAAMSDAEKAVEQARKDGETQATQRANARIIGAEARALAAEAKFRSPSSAVRLLDLSDIGVSDDGAVDAAAIKAKLKELSDAEPWHLDDGKPQERPKPDRSQGGGTKRSGTSLTGLSGDELYDRLHPKKTA